ncbi:hypothetical protein BC831DRAFT_517611 [Entophlyctis helioformis]|nr:hypothetical protein BC831DRAFT_517611 [Entophlyctis helioformis]
MPLAASLSWFIASLLLGLKIYSNNAPIGLYVFGPVSWLADYATRCIVLWFTIGPFGYALYVSAPYGPVATNSIEYINGAVIYAATDLQASVLDCILLARLWHLNNQMRSSALQVELVKPRAFHFTIICLCIIIAVSVLMITVFAIGYDPYWSWYTTFFAFRILFTDIFSNLLRDSLIEAKFEQRQSTLKLLVSCYVVRKELTCIHQQQAIVSRINMTVTVDSDESWTEYRLSFIESNKFSTTTAFLCCVNIALTSRHLYTGTSIGKMPLAASLSWFIASLLLGLKIYSNNAPIGLYVFGPVSWLADYATRCIVLWFTYYRTLAVWPDAVFLFHLTATMQVLSIGPFGYALYVSAPYGPVATNSIEYINGAVIYAATDLQASVLDCILLARLWHLNNRMRNSALQVELVKPRFFYYSILCLSVIILVSVLMITVFAIGYDPYWSWYTTFFSFRIFLTDVFSNLLRDSLIEAKFEQRQSTVTATTTNTMGGVVAPPPSLQNPKPRQRLAKQANSESPLIGYVPPLLASREQASTA